MREIENILIIVDLEGIIGVNNLKDEQKIEKLLYKEIKVIIDAIPEKYKLYFCYEHNNGLIPNSIKNLKRDIIFISKVENIDFSMKYDISFLIGFHGRKFDICKFPHVYRDEIDHIFLGDYEVGEIEIISNLLAFYKIPVVLISAEKIVIDNLLYDCCYHIVDDNADREVQYKELGNCVKKSLVYEGERITYDSSSLKIKYDRDTLIFSEASGIYLQSEFRDTLDFCKKISTIAKKLNKIAERSILFMLKEINRMKPESLEEVKEQYVKDLIITDIDKVGYYELKSIYQYFRDECI